MERQISMVETQAPISASRMMDGEELSSYDVERLMYGFGLVKYLVSSNTIVVSSYKLSRNRTKL